MIPSDESLRIALVAGTLGKGGAEKQLVFMVEALQRVGAQVKVFCATRGEYYESALQALGCDPIWFGRGGSPLPRLATLTRMLRQYRPHVLQSTHFYTNLYVALAARLTGTMAFGSLRNDAVYEVNSNGRWGKWLLRLPPSLIANSQLAKANAHSYGIAAERLSVLSNVIDLDDFDRRAKQPAAEFQRRDVPTVFAVSRLVSQKRLDRFLKVLQLANRQMPIDGVIVGDGPQRDALESQAIQWGLASPQVRFLGWRNDLPSLLKQSDLLIISSDHEGFPNVLLESMAAGIPAIGTPAGDVSEVIVDGSTGYVVPFDDTDAMLQRLLRLAGDPAERQRMGRAARQRVESCYSPETLGQRLLQIYQNTARTQGHHQLVPLLGV